MELFIKDSGQDFLEVIDLAYPQYCFVFRDIKLEVNNGQVEIACESTVVKSLQKKVDDEVSDDLEQEFLDTHMQQIMSELFDPVVNSALH